MADPQTPLAPQGGIATDPLVQNLLARFGTPPSAPNVIPFQQAKQRILQQQQALPVPQAPVLQPTPQNAPAAQVTDIFKTMTPDLMLLGALGGALTGSPITGAVNNMTGFIKGLHEGDAEATQNHLKEFNTNLNAAKTANETAINQYKLTFQQYGGQADKLKSALDGIASREGDTILQYKLHAGEFDEVYKIIEAREKNQEALSNHQLALQRAVGSSLGQPQMVETKDGKQVLAQQDKAGLLTGTPGQWVSADEQHSPIEGVTAAVSATTAGLPQSNEGMANMIAKYAIPPLTGYALRSASGQQTMADVAKINPNYNAVNYDRIHKTVDDFATGPSSKRIVAINTAIQHLHVLQHLADALQSGDVRAVNSARQEFSKQFGEVAPTNFDAVVQIVGKEVVKSIVNGGGGVTERNDAQTAFSRVGSPQQVSGAINSVKQLLAGQMSGLRQQYDTQTKDAPGIISFQELLLPDTQQELGNLTNTSAQPSTPSSFVNGKIYRDANGHRAKYQDGQWLPQ